MQIRHLCTHQRLVDSDEFVVLVFPHTDSLSMRWDHLNFMHIPQKYLGFNDAVDGE